MGEIVDTIRSDMPHDDPLPGDTSLGALLSLLSAGLAFLNFPAGGAAAKTFATAVQQAPGLSTSLLATGSLGDKVTPVDQIQSSLGDLLQQLQINLANTLNETQSDYNAFVALTANGSFIADTLSLNATTQGLTRLLKTYVVSQALQSHNIIITVARNFSVYELSHRKFSGQAEDGVMLPYNKWHVNCQDPPDQFGVCDNWWVDSSTNDSYALFKLDDMEHNFFGLMEKIFANQWTSGEELFIGAQNCMSTSLGDYLTSTSFTYASWRLVQSPTVETSNFQGSCFSNIRVCDWDLEHDLHVQDGLELASHYANEDGCLLAWPNLCVDGQGFIINRSSPNLSLLIPQHYPLSSNNTYSLYLNNAYNGAGRAQVYCNLSDTGSSSSAWTLLDARTVARGFADFTQDGGVNIAYNSLYDFVNTPLDTLQAQAKSMDPKKCKEFPSDNKLPGWGGAGYHVHDKNCNRYPASYLGAGLYFKTELCGPLP